MQFRPCLTIVVLLAVHTDEALAKDPTGVTPNRIWPADAPVDKDNLSKSKKAACARIPARTPEELLRNIEYPTSELNRAPGGEGSLLGSIVAYRSSQKGNFASTQQICQTSRIAQADSGSHDDRCEGAWTSYWYSLAVPFAIPLVCCAALILIWWTCCFVACCRCCRRMICCQEAREPIPITRNYAFLGLLIWSGASITQVAFCSSLLEANESLHQAINWNSCVAHTFAEEALYGGDWFLGTEPSVERLTSLATALDVDSRVMKTVRSVLSASMQFAEKHKLLRRRLRHFNQTLAEVGFGRRVFDHRCVFCNLAQGQGNDGPQAAPPLRYPKNGLLNAISDQVESSSSSAMHHIREFSTLRLTGANLTDLARKVKRAKEAFTLFDQGLRDALPNLWGRLRPHVDLVESIRYSLSVLLCALSIVGAFTGWLAFLITRVRLVKWEDDHKRRPPSGKQHCCSWCCGFVHGVLAILLGGSLLFAAAPAGEACQFVRQELLTYGGMETYAPLLGFVRDPAAGISASAVDGAVKLAQSCFAQNRTGKMLEAVDITSDYFSFEPELTKAFYGMDGRGSEPPVGVRTQDFLEHLLTAAEEYGSSFVLEPVNQESLLSTANGSLGPLELSPNVKSLLLGSSLEADNTKAADAVTVVTGLNVYAELIAGPGQYTFLHGTAGGGFVVTPSRPTEAELSSVPLHVGNALRFAKNKERLLASNDSLPCDVLKASGEVQLRRCGIYEFRAHLISEVRLIKETVAETIREAEAVHQLFVQVLKSQLLPMLSSVKGLSSLLSCSAMWRRLEELDQSFCEEVATTVARGSIQALAQFIVAIVGVFVQYKAWRRLKDNKVLEEELERFEKNLAKHMRELAKIVVKSPLQPVTGDGLKPKPKNDEDKNEQEDDAVSEEEEQEDDGQVNAEE